ncbi:MAG TPA: retron system putative HNH endonuclease [Buttiauxella sp.]|nr:retron system putative HNH endonuclease [Buttiauxella sp.]
MRYIIKGNPDYFLSQQNKSKPNSPAKAQKAWSRFNYKPATVKVCLIEQYGLCCYSEISLNHFDIFGYDGNCISKDTGYHLEHIEPKSLAPHKTFEHNNLALSAISSANLKTIDKRDVFGGHFKKRRYSQTSFISPLMENAQDYFHFEISGRVVPKASLPNRREKAKARLTIYILNLNAPILINWRMVWISAMSKIIDESDIEVIEQMAELELSPIGHYLRPFHTAQKQLFGKIGDRVCQRYNI